MSESDGSIENDEVQFDADDIVVPSELKGLRACKGCGLVKTLQQFSLKGCENCPFMGRGQRAQEYTTSKFQGFVAILSPQDSWIAQCTGHNLQAPGTYALAVDGFLNDVFLDKFQEKGIKPFSALRQTIG
eukprot:ANDGO_04073.mRNA.1 Transcription elongation factor SPT4